MISHPAPLSNAVLKTPQTEERIRPPLEEMHPSKVQQSTAKQPDSGLRLGFSDINAQHEATPSKSAIKVVDSSPTQVRRDPIASPKMNFNWDRPESLLSPEGQKIMESVREDAAQIKLKMQQEREEQVRRDGEAKQLFGVGGRQLAQPKGKSGRYSDIHKQEFKKMDSIAGHASTWKKKLQVNASASLKRSKSKAGFDEPESSQGASDKPPVKIFETGRLENTAPGKRLKQSHHDDTSTARAISRDSQKDTRVPASGIPRANLALPSVMTTPTKASLARSASVKNQQPSKIPSLNHSKSAKELTSPGTKKADGGNKYLSTLSRIGSVKSILHKPPPKFSDDPVKVAAGTHLQTPRGKANLAKDLPNIPGTPTGTVQNSPVKHVNFTPTTQSKIELAAASPSPTKIPLPHSQRLTLQPSERLEVVAYPSLANLGPLNSNPPQPSDFTFRSPKKISVGLATSGLKNPKKTIRQVRPSGIATPLAPFDNLPAIPHGMANKKRRREEQDEDSENLEPGADDAGDEEGPSPKKQKSSGDVAASSGVDRKKGAPSKIAKPLPAKEKGKGRGLSMSRLNTLARPKGRR